MRPTKDSYFMMLALVVATRGTCRRRSVGCVITDHLDRILSTGYNGNPATMQHCLDVPCAGAHSPAGQNLDSCLAVHAEQNAVAYCQDIRWAETLYSTTQPCVTCTKLLLSTPIKRIVYLEGYPHPSAEYLWLESGRTYATIKDISQLESAASIFTSLGLDMSERLAEL